MEVHLLETLYDVSCNPFNPFLLEMSSILRCQVITATKKAATTVYAFALNAIQAVTDVASPLWISYTSYIEC